MAKIVANSLNIKLENVAGSSKNTLFDNSNSSLSATNVQDAIDEINGKVWTKIIIPTEDPGVPGGIWLEEES